MSQDPRSSPESPEPEARRKGGSEQTLPAETLPAETLPAEAPSCETIPGVGTGPPAPRAPSPSPPGAATIVDAPAGLFAPTLPADGSAGTQGQAGAAKSPARRRFGRYELVGELGRGGMGVVYKAFRSDLDTHFAVKVLLAGENAGEGELERFHREARAAARLRHPGIVPVHDVGVEEGKHYFAMEYVEGMSLAQVLEDPEGAGLGANACWAPGPGAAAPRGRRRGLRPRLAIRMAKEIAEALQHAHEAGVVHRDLKPSNVLREPSGRLRVMDFGLARLLDASPIGATRTGTLMGTPAYMSPEQAAGRVKEVDERSDVYQLGALLYELLTGSAPYDGESPMDVVLKVLAEEPPAPRTLEPRIDLDVDTICLKAMARDRGRRYASARELAADCARYLDDETILARPEGLVERAARWSRRRRLAAIPVAVIVLTALVAGGAWWHSRRTKDEHGAKQEADLTELRQMATLHLKFALDRRHVGASMEGVAREFVPRLQQAADKVMTRDSTLPEPHYDLGRLYRAVLRLPEAMQEQALALELSPRYLPSLYERAVLSVLQYERGLTDEATEAVAAGLAGHGSEPRQDEKLVLKELLVAAGRWNERDPAGRRRRASALADLERFLAVYGETPAEPSEGPAVAKAQLACAKGLALLYGPRSPEAWARAGEFLEEALGMEPAMEEAHEGRAQLALASARLQATVEAYDRGLKVDHGNFFFWLRRARAKVLCAAAARTLYGLPETLLAGALDDYEHAAELEPSFVEARLGRGDALVDWADMLERQASRRKEGLAQLKLKDPEEALALGIAEYAKAVTLAPDCLEGWLGKARGLREWGRYRSGHGGDAEEPFANALECYSKVVELRPTRGEGWLGRGETRTKLGAWRRDKGQDPGRLFAEATEDFAEAMRLQPATQEPWEGRAEALLEWSRWTEARGEDANGLYERALADLEAALPFAHRRAALWVKRAEACLRWARFRRDRGEPPATQYGDAVLDCTLALEADGQAWSAFRRRAEARHEWGLWLRAQRGDATALLVEAVADYGRYLERKEDDADARQLRAEAALAIAACTIEAGGDPAPHFETALAEWGKLLELQPHSAAPRRDRAFARFQWGLQLRRRGADPRGQFEEALRDLDTVITRDPSDPLALARRGRIRVAQERWTEAATDFEAALRLAPRDEKELRPLLEEARRRAAAAPAGNGAR